MSNLVDRGEIQGEVLNAILSVLCSHVAIKGLPADREEACANADMAITQVGELFGKLQEDEEMEDEAG